MKPERHDAMLTLLETNFPAFTVSKVAEADRRRKDPAYASHRWWARRPPAVMRALLLAATLKADTSDEEFWKHYADNSKFLTGKRVHDPFMGGGSTLIEATRLGANVSGTDVDPIAQAIVTYGLQPANKSEVMETGEELMAFLRHHFLKLYPDQEGEPLHWFWIYIVTCPQCKMTSPLYRSHILVRDCGKPGAVIRDHGATVFDADTFQIHYLKSAYQKTFTNSIGKRTYIDQGSFKNRKFHCAKCGKSSNHRELQTASSPQRMIAVERTPTNSRRKLFEPNPKDVAAVNLAIELLQKPPVRLHLPIEDFKVDRSDPRPRSFGITAIKDLFTPRQLLILGAAHAWIQDKDLSPSTSLAVRLALSNALATNNRLCSYATDYGRLSALFSIRGYSLPALTVELNPLHSKGGRGTLQQCLARVGRSAVTSVHRSIWNIQTKETTLAQFDFTREKTHNDVQCSSAANTAIESDIDLLIFDPPYYDYINYDELTELFRAWNSDFIISGQTLQSAVSKHEDNFGVTLADCLRPAILARRSRHPIVFTYHSSQETAWKAIGIALDEVKLRVTGLWPVRSDSHMGHHSYPGNCEWDVVVVCRPLNETIAIEIPVSLHQWDIHLGDLNVNDADRLNFLLAYQMASLRYGMPTDRTKQEA